MPLAPNTISSETVPASVSLHVAEVSDQQAEVRGISVSAAKPRQRKKFNFAPNSIQWGAFYTENIFYNFF